MDYTQVIEFYGTQAEAARKLGIRQPSVWAWQKKPIPIERQIDIELKTGGKLRADLPKSLRRQAA